MFSPNYLLSDKVKHPWDSMEFVFGVRQYSGNHTLLQNLAESSCKKEFTIGMAELWNNMWVRVKLQIENTISNIHVGYILNQWSY